MPKYYDPELIIKVNADLLQGNTAIFVSKKYNIPVSTVRNWSAKLLHSGEREINGDLIREEVSKRVSSLLLGFLDKAKLILDTIDAEYIKKQPAADLAQLLGVISDKAFRILDAAARSEQANGDVIEGEVVETENTGTSITPA